MKSILLVYIRHVYSFTPLLLAPTPHALESMRGYGLDRVTEIGEWGRGVDTKVFTPEARSLEWRREMGFKDSDVVVVFCSR